MAALPLERLWARLVPEGDCLVWPGASSGGYGLISCGIIGRRNVYAHRVAYELAVGPIPDGFEVDHLCFNRKCCNPLRLEAVTKLVNAQRRGARVVACPQEHEYTKENTIICLADGARRCRECRRLRDKCRPPRIYPPRPKIERLCLSCGIPFVVGLHQYKYCTAECRNVRNLVTRRLKAHQ
jgi:hypothetical protein